MTTPTPDDLAKWHRWFAVECNNRGWDLANQETRTETEDVEFLQVAYAAAFHWSQVGQPINVARADVLLAFALAKTGQADAATARSQGMIHRLTECGEKAEHWDWAFAYAAVAATAASAGDKPAHRKNYDLAVEAAKSIEGEGDRKIFDEQFLRLTPKPS